jgi:hypothetical protein
MIARSAWLWLSLGLLGLWALGGPLAGADPEEADTPGAAEAEEPNATRPAVTAGGHDPAAGAIDPLDLVEEFVRFSVAAGGEKELDEAAFHANRERHNPFVRPFDRWETLLVFDRNGDGKISWAEAAQYRRELRRQMLAAYDADRNGRLQGEERSAANKALAEGRLPALAAPKDRDRAETAPEEPAASQPSPATPTTEPATQADEEE